MHASLRLRRIVLAAAFALPGLALPPSAARAGDFQASGTSESISNGHFFELSLSGVAQPGGTFGGTVLGKQLGNSGRQKGSGVLDFGNGDTLIYIWAVEVGDNGQLIGGYVITGGTGVLEDASGSGNLVVVPAGDGTTTFEMDGTLDF
jgi:hypothetical protein